MGLFIKKPFSMLQAEANESGAKTLKRVLGAWSLVALGVGVIIGAGLFSITGRSYHIWYSSINSRTSGLHNYWTQKTSPGIHPGRGTR